MEKEIFRYISKEGGKAEFRFTNGKCDGFFVDDKREYDDKYKGKFLDDDFIKGLKVSGFKKTKSLQLLFNKQKIMLKENKQLKKTISKFKEALIWCSGSKDFQLEGKARKGWEKICVPLLK